MDSKVFPASKARVLIDKRNSETNSAVLDGIRSIIRNQIDLIKQDSTERMSPAQADTLYKLTKTYQLMDVSTDKENSKYDFSNYSVESLEDVAAGRIKG